MDAAFIRRRRRNATASPWQRLMEKDDDEEEEDSLRGEFWGDGKGEGEVHWADGDDGEDGDDGDDDATDDAADVCLMKGLTGGLEVLCGKGEDDGEEEDEAPCGEEDEGEGGDLGGDTGHDQCPPPDATAAAAAAAAEGSRAAAACSTA